jgi:hypothetical protein
MTPRSRPWTVAFLFLAASPAAAETRTFDLVTYTAPDGWKVAETDRGLVSVSRTTPAGYCMVNIYGSTPAVGDLDACFASEWKAVVLRTIDSTGDGDATPAATQGNVGNTRAAMGGTPATIKGAPAIALLMVLDAGASVVSIVTLASNMETFQGCSAEVQKLLGSVSVRRVAAPPPSAPPSGDAKPLVVPRPSRALTVADLAGEWKHEDRFSTTYVDRHTGAYAGSEHLAYRDTWTITAKGSITSDFFGIKNGKKILEKTTGTLSLSANIIDVKMGAGPKYIVRGWLETPAFTVMKIVGPFYDEVPADHLGDSEKGSNLSATWVRRKPAPK